jgi:hypothetical protein
MPQQKGLPPEEGALQNLRSTGEVKAQFQFSTGILAARCDEAARGVPVIRPVSSASTNHPAQQFPAAFCLGN